MNLLRGKTMTVVACIALLIALVACKHEIIHDTALEPTDDTACVLDGMLLKHQARRLAGAPA